MGNNSKTNSFFYKMRSLSEKQEKLADYPKVVFANLESTMKYGVLSESDMDRFIMRNYEMSVVALTAKYNNEVLPAENKIRAENGQVQKKEKAVSTFRTQRAHLSALLFEIFGEGFASYFYTKNDDVDVRDYHRKLYDISIKADILKNRSLMDATILLRPCTNAEFHEPFMEYAFEDCKMEILFLSMYSQQAYKNGIEVIDKAKLSYLESLLSRPFTRKREKKTVIDREKLRLLVLMSKVVKSDLYSFATLAKNTDGIIKMNEKDILFDRLIEENKTLKVQNDRMKAALELDGMEADVLFKESGM